MSLAKYSRCKPGGMWPGSSSGGQLDQPCKLFDGAGLAQVLSWYIELRAIIAVRYGQV